MSAGKSKGNFITQALPPPAARVARTVRCAVVVSVLVASLGLYWLTLAPTITWRFSGSDSAELASAAYSWGIPHPTGYPLWTFLGFLITRAPYGDMAGRTNLLSALCAAATAALVGLIVFDLTARIVASADVVTRAIAALSASLALATAPAFWSQSVLTEVYSLNCLFIALIVWLLSSSRKSTGPNLLTFASGLALTNHLTALFAVLPALAVTTVRRSHWPLRRSGMTMSLLIFMAPLTLYLLIPLRAAQHPAENWNDPQTLPRFFQLVTGSQYHYLLAWSDPAATLGSASAIVRLFLGQFAWWVLPIALYGLTLVFEADRPLGLFSVSSAALYAGFTAVYRAEGAQYYLLPAYVIEAVLAGVGFAGLAVALSSRVRRGRLTGLAGPAMIMLLGLAGVVPFVAVRYREHDLHEDRAAFEFAYATLQQAAPRALLLTDSDEETFSLWYVQKVEGFRRDVRVVDVRMESP